MRMRTHLSRASVPKPAIFGIWLPADGLTHRDITIFNLAAGHTKLVEHGEVWAPPSFTARVDRPPLPLVELDIERVQSRFRCTQAHVTRRKEETYITPKQLKDIPLATLVREAVAMACYFVVPLANKQQVDSARHLFAMYADLEADPIDLEAIQVGDFFRFPVATVFDDLANKAFVETLLNDAEPSRRDGIPTDQAVADEYRRAYDLNQPVIDAVAARFGWTRQTAKNRTAQARRAGYLPETVPGKRLA